LTLLADRKEKFYLGNRCRIASEASVSDSILWDDVVVESGASVGRAVLGDGVRIPAGEVIHNAVVVRNSLVAGKPVPGKALPGTIKGENFVVPLSQ
jgi:NDP-sugar pyrophosphorylase family protein